MIIRLLTVIMLITSILSCQTQRDFKTSRAETKIKQKERREAYAEAEREKEIRIEAEKRAITEAMEQEKSESGAEAAPVDPPRYVVDSLLFQFERRPCFGRCPIYKIKIYESGYTTYEGVNFVEYMGYYQTRLSQVEVAKIYTLIAESDFFSLDDKYDDERLMDLPSMIFRARAMGQDKRIIARYNIPEVLTELGQKLDLMFKETAWEPVVQ